MYEAQLLGAINALYDVNDQMGVELMGWSAWNGLKKAVTKVTSKALNTVSKAPKKAVNVVNPFKSSTSKSFWKSKLNGVDELTEQLFGFNDELGEELLGGWWTNLKNGVSSATHSVLNAGSKIPYVSDAVSDVRSVANIFKKSSSANDSANAAIESVSDWIKANKLKTALIVGGVGAGVYFLMRKKKRK